MLCLDLQAIARAIASHRAARLAREARAASAARRAAAKASSREAKAAKVLEAEEKEAELKRVKAEAQRDEKLHQAMVSEAKVCRQPRVILTRINKKPRA